MRRHRSGSITVLGKLGVGKKSRKGNMSKNRLARQLRMESLEDRCMLTTVTTDIDVNDTFDGATTLREAIASTVAGGTVVTEKGTQLFFSTTHSGGGRGESVRASGDRALALAA